MVESFMISELRKNKLGFTLIEILITMAISGIILTVIYTVYDSQNKTYLEQEEIATMQQNLRTSMFIMLHEMRMAGFDPTGNAGAGITAASSNSIKFTKDLNRDGNFVDDSGADVNEEVEYYLYTSDGIQKLGRKSPSTSIVQPVAENVDALDFVYLDQDGNVIDDDGSGNVTTNISDIRSVQISLVVKTDKKVLAYTDNIDYSNQQGDIILAKQNDSFRRRLLTIQVRCRNLGL